MSGGVFAGFESKDVRVNGINVRCRVGGKGPGLLLLHGHPQTHVIWHRVAEPLASRFTVVAADLRGYGDTDKPPASDGGSQYAKREMARDQRELMQSLGFEHFMVLAHDRGARVAHRLAVDFPNAVDRMILLDIAPTLAMYEQTNEAFARAYWHWFFLIRPAPLPESLIEANPQQYLESVMGSRSAGLNPFTEAAFAEYLRCLRLPGTATGMCEDYRASAGIDLQHDKDDRANGVKVECPIRVLWGEQGVIAKCFSPLDEWNRVATDVSGMALPCGHYIPEELPDRLLEESFAFFSSRD